MDENVVVAVKELVPQAMIAELGVNSCLVASHAAIEVLDYFRINARPLSVQLLVFNDLFAERMAQRVPPPTSDAERQQWVDEGAIGIGVGYEAREPGNRQFWFPGHLVTIVEKQALLDLSVTQVNKPQWGINLAPLALAVNPEFLAGTAPLQLALKEFGVNVKYEALPEDRRKEVVRSCLNTKDGKAFVGRLIKAVREKVGP